MSYPSYADDTQIYQVIKPQGDWSDYMHQLKLAIEFDQCYESAENTIFLSHRLAVPYWWFYQSTFLDFSHNKTLQHVLSHQFLSRYTGCPFITVANTNFLYMCTKHSMARLLAIFKPYNNALP
jgi:hypothetical protein